MIDILYKAYQSNHQLPFSQKTLKFFGASNDSILQYLKLRDNCVFLIKDYLHNSDNPKKYSKCSLFARAYSNYLTFILNDTTIALDCFCQNFLNNISKKVMNEEYFSAFLEEKTLVYFLNIQERINTPVQESSVNFCCIPSDQVDFFPESTILVAYLAKGKHQHLGYILIVADLKDQNTKKAIYWVGRTLSAAVLAAIASDRKRRFEYKYKKYRVSHWEEFPLAKKYFNVITRFCSPDEPQEVYIFEQKNLDQYNSPGYEMVTAMVPCSRFSFLIPIQVYYNKNTHQYFMNEVSYTIAREKYGIPYVKLNYAELTTPDYTFGALKTRSKLNLLGYTVSVSSGKSIEERHSLLKYIMDSQIMQKVEVINHIEWLIKTRQESIYQQNAVAAWKNDLEYISQYQVEEQRRIWVSAFKAKYSKQRTI